MPVNPETRLTDRLKKRLRERGAWFEKQHGSSYSTAGVPDLLVCYRGIFVGVEVKMPGKKATTLQLYQGKKIEEAGGIFGVVHDVDELEALLKKVENKALTFLGV